MASLNLSQEELKAVEQSRQRLSQLSNSINSLKKDVLQSNPLPSMYVYTLFVAHASFPFHHLCRCHMQVLEEGKYQQ